MSDIFIPFYDSTGSSEDDSNDSEKELDKITRNTIIDFASKSESFTALDVTNKVKETLPNVRHRDVRKIVKNMFDELRDEFEYECTQINVTLADGQITIANLYHPVEDANDLDHCYDISKRSQVLKVTSTKPSDDLDNDSSLDDKKEYVADAKDIPLSPSKDDLSLSLSSKDNENAKVVSDKHSMEPATLLKKRLAELGLKILDKILN